MAHKKPTAMLKLSGAFDSNPSRGRARENEPIVNEDLGEPPERLTPRQQDAWRELSNNCAYGVLTRADRHSAEIAAVLLAEFWANGVQMQGTHLSLLERILGKMGMAPADRSRVTASEQRKDNPFSKFRENPFSNNGRRP